MRYLNITLNLNHYQKRVKINEGISIYFIMVHYSKILLLFRNNTNDRERELFKS